MLLFKLLDFLLFLSLHFGDLACPIGYMNVSFSILYKLSTLATFLSFAATYLEVLKNLLILKRCLAELAYLRLFFTLVFMVSIVEFSRLEATTIGTLNLLVHVFLMRLFLSLGNATVT